MPMSIRILLYVIAIILFIIAGVRMRTKRGKSITEIVIRALTLIIFFAVMFLADQFLNDDDSIIAILITFSILIYGYNIFCIYKIKRLKRKIDTLENGGN